MVIRSHSIEMRVPPRKQLNVTKHMLKKTTLFLMKGLLHLPRPVATQMLWLTHLNTWTQLNPRQGIKHQQARKGHIALNRYKGQFQIFPIIIISLP